MKKIIQLKLLSKILIFTLLISNLYFPMEALAASAETDFPSYSVSKDYGRGVFSAAVNGGAICYDSYGKPLMCFTTQGGKFFACDLLTGKVVFETKTTGNYKMAHLVKTASDGKVYVHYETANTFDVYDPKTGEYKEMYPGMYIFSQDGGNVTDDGKILIGEFNEVYGASAHEYDIATNTVKKYGPLNSDWGYIKGIDADENYIYAGTGFGEGKGNVVRINKTTKQKDVLNIPNASIVYNVKVNSDKVIAQTNGTIHIIDKDTFTYITKIGGDIPSDQSPYDEDIFYTIEYNNDIYKIDTANNKREWLCLIKNIDEYEAAEFTQWATLPTGEKVLGFRTNIMNKIGYFNPKTTEVVTHQLDRIADSGPNIQSLEISPEGVIYMGGYQTAMAAYDIKSEEFLFNFQYWDQNEGVGFLNGKTYFGIYSGAEIWRYDPNKAWNYKQYNSDGKYQGGTANPAMVYDIGDEQDRPYVIKEYNDKLYIGTIPDYGKLGGALTIYSEDASGTPSADVFRNVIANQSITGIAVKDNLVYLSSSILGGKDSVPSETQAKIAVFDTNTNTVVTEPFAPNLPIVGKTSKTIGELSFGPDGLLWGASTNKGLVFAMDPETFEVKKYVSVATNDLGGKYRPLYLRWGADGLLYTTAGWNVTVINPDTMNYKVIVGDCSLMTLDPYGDIWYARGGNFYKIEVSQFARLKAILDSIDYNDYESSIALGELKLLCDSAKEITEDASNAEIIEAINAITSKQKELYNTSKYVSGFSAELDYLKQTVKISGTLKTGEEVSVRILSPEGEEVLLDQVSKDVKSFTKTYRISPLLKGEYKIYLDAKSYAKPVMRVINSNPPENGILINNVSASDGSGVVVTTRLSNYYNKTVTLNVFVAEYYKQTDILKQATFETHTVNQGDFAIFKSQLGEGSDTDFKLFIWDENMAPITDPFEN